MNRLVNLVPVVLLLAAQSVEAQSWSDVCEVYVMDVRVAQKAFKEFRPTGDEAKDGMALKAGTNLVGTFSTKVGEDLLTTRTYRLPVGRLLVTASVFYSEKSMVTAAGRDSIVIGLAIAEKPVEDARGASNNAVAQTPYGDSFTAVRVNKLAIIKGRQWWFGLECRKPEAK